MGNLSRFFLIISLFFVSALAEPTQVSSVATANAGAIKVTSAEDFMFVGDGTNLEIYDISNKSDIQAATNTNIAIGGTINAIEFSASENFAYIAYDGGFKELDISNPDTSSLTGNSFADGDIKDIAIDGSYAYIVSGTSFKMIDLGTFTQIGNTISLTGSTSGNVLDIEISGTTAYISGDGGVYSIPNIDTPALVEQGDIVINDIGDVESLEVVGGSLYAVGNGFGFTILDATDISSQTGNTALSGPFDVKIDSANSIAYVSTSNTDIKIFDISGANPNYISFISSSGDAKVEIGNYLYSAEGNQGAKINDVSSVTPKGVKITNLVIGGAGPASYTATITFEYTPDKARDAIAGFTVKNLDTGEEIDVPKVGGQDTYTATFNNLSSQDYSFEVVAYDDIDNSIVSEPVQDGVFVGAPQISATPNPLDFGVNTQGSNENLAITVENTGSANLELQNPSFVLTNDAGGEFQVASDDCAGDTLGQGATCTITVTYNRNAAANAVHSGLIQIDSTNAVDVDVVLEGEVGTADPKLELTDPLPEPVTFYSSVNAAALTKTLTIKNVGVNGADFTSFAIANDTSGGKFAVDSYTCTAGNGKDPLVSGDICTVTISYDRSAVAALSSADLKVDSNSINDPFYVSLEGKTTLTDEATLSISEGGVSLSGGDSVDFGAAAQLTTTTKTFTIENTGTLTLEGLSVALATGVPEYEITSDNCGATLNPNGQAGDSCEVVLTYHRPDADTPDSDTLNISSTNATNSPIAISLSGNTGNMPIIDVSADTTADFGSDTNGNSSFRDFTVTNTGSADLTITDISIQNQNPGGGAYEIDLAGSSCDDLAGGVLGSGLSCKVRVNFTRVGGVDSYTADLRLTSDTNNAAGTDTDTALTGEITGAVVNTKLLSISPDSFTTEFQVDRTESKSELITISNLAAATDNLSITAIALAGADSAEATLNNNPNANGCGGTPTLAPGDSCQVEVTFTGPSTGGDDIVAYDVKLSITHDGTNEASPKEIDLSAEVIDKLSISYSGGLLFGTVKSKNDENSALRDDWDENTDYQTKTFTFRNNGLVDITTLALDLTYALDTVDTTDGSYKFVSTTCTGGALSDLSLNNAEVPAGGSCSVVLKFQPQFVGAYSYNIDWDYNPSGTLSGTGTGGAVTVTIGNSNIAVPISPLANIVLMLSILAVGGYFAKRKMES